MLQDSLPIYSLPQDWLWCGSWCSDASQKRARTIDLCNNPRTLEHKLDYAQRAIPVCYFLSFFFFIPFYSLFHSSLLSFLFLSLSLTRAGMNIINRSSNSRIFSRVASTSQTQTTPSKWPSQRKQTRKIKLQMNCKSIDHQSFLSLTSLLTTTTLMNNK